VLVVIAIEVTVTIVVVVIVVAVIVVVIIIVTIVALCASISVPSIRPLSVDASFPFCFVLPLLRFLVQKPTCGCQHSPLKKQLWKCTRLLQQLPRV
jgi:hypothetical protein